MTRAPGTATSWVGRCRGSSAPKDPLETLLVGRRGGDDARCLLRAAGIESLRDLPGRRGAVSRVMDNSYRLLDPDCLWAAGGVGVTCRPVGRGRAKGEHSYRTGEDVPSFNGSSAPCA